MRHQPGFVLPAFLFALLAGASTCAGTPQPRTEAPARIKDSPPEKVAAQRASLSNLNLEAEDERWGMEAARERKQRTGGTDTAAAPPSPPPSGPTDLGKPRSSAAPR